MKSSKKKAYEMREDFKKFIKGEKAMHGYSEEEAEALEDWLLMLVANLSKASENALHKFVRRTGHAEAFLIGLARFTCTIIQNMEDEGFTTKAGSVWDYYYLALLPTAHDIEKLRDRDNSLEEELAIALMDPSQSIRKIYKRFFPDLPEKNKDECMRELQKTRNMFINNNLR